MTDTPAAELLISRLGELIRHWVLLEAKQMLDRTMLSVAKVAFTLNFDDNSYLGKFFKKYVGVNTGNVT